MAHPDDAQWQQCWRDQHIDFHQTTIHPLLPRFWPMLGLSAADRVFVPLCGKSLDLMWLHAQGHDVIGVELSPIAVRAFFKESRLQPHRVSQGELIRWEQERLRIYCGDFFALTATDLLGVTALYDRAALTALPTELRPEYVAHLRRILPATCRQLLLTVEDLDEGESEADASLPSTEIASLYAGHFHVALLHAQCFPASPGSSTATAEPRSVHKAYLIHTA